MPEISNFLGIALMMYYREHQPPHFHARYNEYTAEIEIKTLTVLKGKLPPRVLGLVMEWAELHTEELLDNWNVGRVKGNIKKIPPLV